MFKDTNLSGKRAMALKHYMVGCKDGRIDEQIERDQTVCTFHHFSNDRDNKVF